MSVSIVTHKARAPRGAVVGLGGGGREAAGEAEARVLGALREQEYQAGPCPLAAKTPRCT